MSTVGRILDAVAQHVLDANAVIYQLISMIVVLGLLLFLQWRLLRLALDSRLNVALAFLLTIFMLQPDTYWGRQNMGYHQAIPLVCMLGALYLALAPKSTSRWNTMLAFAVSLIAGFSYISGAIAMLMIGITLVVFGPRMSGAAAQRARNVGLAVLAGALVSVPAQLWVIIGVHGGETHRPDAAWTLPYEADYWLYLLGMVARSLLLPKKYPIVGLTIAASLCLATIAIAIWFAAKLLRRQLSDPRLARMAIIVVALVASVGAYLCIVSAGRAQLQAEDADTASGLFVAGYRRFYFAWVTLVWPWLAAFALRGSDARDGVAAGRTPPYAIVTPAVLLVCTLGVVAGAASHVGYYKKLNKGRIETQVNCLEEQLRAGVGILCPRLHPGDLASAYIYADSIGSSFTRRYPLPTVGLGEPGPAPIFRLSAAEGPMLSRASLAIHDAKLGDLLPTTDATGLDIQPEAAETFRACVHLQAGFTASDGMQVLFRRRGQQDFDQATERQPRADIGASPQAVYFDATSHTGFEPILNVRPRVEGQEIHITEIEIRCLLRRR